VQIKTTPAPVNDHSAQIIINARLPSSGTGGTAAMTGAIVPQLIRVIQRHKLVALQLR
jgi:hypothetical protein